MDGDELQTDLEKFEAKLDEIDDPELIAAVFTTTSCFAPRACDDLPSIAKVFLQQILNCTCKSFKL